MLKRVLKPVAINRYNHTHHTRLISRYASLRASYGREVLIDRGTVVESDVSIGDYSYVNKNSYVENCSIGKYCSISSGVYICPFEHDLSRVSTHPRSGDGRSHGKARRPVTIGNDVLISLNAIILEGVTIGDGAVVAAGAVVNRDVRPYEIVGGVPAKHIGSRCTQEEAEAMERIRWWDWEPGLVEKKRKEFSDIGSFVKKYGKAE